MFNTFHINDDNVVVPCKNLIECSTLNHYHSAAEAWAAQDVVNGNGGNNSKENTIVEAMELIEKYESLNYHYFLDDISSDFWRDIKKVQVELIPHENKLIFTGVTLPVILEVSFQGDCCSRSEVYPLITEKDEGFIENITTEYMGSEEIDDYDVQKTNHYTINFTTGEKFTIKDVNTSNGYYSTNATFNLSLNS